MIGYYYLIDYQEKIMNKLNILPEEELKKTVKNLKRPQEDIFIDLVRVYNKTIQDFINNLNLWEQKQNIQKN